MSKHIDYEINRELGECYLFMGELDKASDYYNKAIDCETGAAEPYLGLATIAAQKGNVSEALEYYRAAANIEPSDKSLTGIALGEAEFGNFSVAFDYCAQALGHNPVNMIAINLLVQSGYKTSRMAEVVPHLEEALRHGENESIRFTLAGCLSYLARNEEARTQLEILLGHNPENANAQELYAHIAA